MTLTKRIEHNQAERIKQINTIRQLTGCSPIDGGYSVRDDWRVELPLEKHDGFQSERLVQTSKNIYTRFVANGTVKTFILIEKHPKLTLINEERIMLGGFNGLPCQ